MEWNILKLYEINEFVSKEKNAKQKHRILLDKK